MESDSSQKKRSPCDKFMQMVRKILKLSSFPPITDGGSSSSPSMPHRQHPVVKQPIKQTPERGNNVHVSGSDRRGSSHFIEIGGNDHQDTGRAHDMQTSELEDTITNFKFSDYIKRFHERNMRDYYIYDASATTTTVATTTTLSSK